MLVACERHGVSAAAFRAVERGRLSRRPRRRAAHRASAGSAGTSSSSSPAPSPATASAYSPCAWATGAQLADGRGRLYAEKALMAEDGQRTPHHYHVVKTEDIVNRGGGALRRRTVQGRSRRRAAARSGSASVKDVKTLDLGPGDSRRAGAGREPDARAVRRPRLLGRGRRGPGRRSVAGQRRRQRQLFSARRSRAAGADRGGSAQALRDGARPFALRPDRPRAGRALRVASGALTRAPAAPSRRESRRRSAGARPRSRRGRWAARLQTPRQSATVMPLVSAPAVSTSTATRWRRRSATGRSPRRRRADRAW